MKEETFDQIIEIPNSLYDFLKRGIYKQLHQRKLLSDGQLDMLLTSKERNGGSTDGQ